MSTDTHTPLDVRVQLAFLWTTTMLIVAFVDIFGFFRPDVREQIEAGRAFVFTIDQSFMLGIVAYVAVPTLMIVLSMWLPRRANRATNIAVAALFSLTIVGAAVGEWAYYLAASALEVALLAAIVTLAIRWRSPERVARTRQRSRAVETSTS